ncbi:MAG: succinylglutamate desuccinylase/aspartoacylase family protein [Planctomycetota bacterium]
MSENYDAPVTDRIVVDIVGSNPGPNLIFTGAVHGNEPSGVIAMQEILRPLNQMDPAHIRGRIVGLIGNCQAFKQKQRFIRYDLNRIWTEENEPQFRTVFNGSDQQNSLPPTSDEFLEQQELFSVIEPMLANGRNCIFLDLHTTSSISSPFIGIDDFPANHQFASQFPVPKILGLDKYITGPMLGYLGKFGAVGLAVEAGQHEDPNSIRVHKTAIEQALLISGAVDENLFLPTEDPAQVFANAKSGIFEVVYRHCVQPDDEFQMMPGFENFTPITTDTHLANSKSGKIFPPCDGFIFMPLYQTSGSDGFFVVKQVDRPTTRMESEI